MADENTITTVFRANIDQFSASTQEMKRYMGLVNAEFQEATAGLGKFSDSTDGLQAKLKQLDGTLAGQKKQLAALESQYNSMTDEQKQNTKEGQKLATEILKQRAEVKKTEKQIGDYSKALNDLEKAGVSTRQELDKLTKSTKQSGTEAESAAGKIAKGIGKGLIGIGTTIAGVATSFLALAESTKAYRQEQAKLETAFLQAGHTAEEAKNLYAEFNSVLGDTQNTTETMQQLAAISESEEDLIEYTNILTGAFATFGKAINTKNLAESINQTAQLGKVQGTLQKALEFGSISIEDFNEELAKCNTQQERNKLIQQTLNKIYGETGKAYKKNNKNLIEAQKAQIKLTQAVAELGRIAEPIATMLKNSISDLIEAITPFVDLIANGLKTALEGSAEGAKNFADGLTGIITTLLNKAKDILPTIIDLIAEIIPVLIKEIVNATPELIKAIANAITQIADALSDMIPEILETIVAALPKIVEAIVKAIPLVLEAAIKLFTAIVKAIPPIIKELIKELPKIITTIISELTSKTSDIVNAALELFNGIIEAIPEIINELIKELPTIIKAIVTGLIKGVPELVKAGGELLAGLFKGLLNPKNIWENIKKLGQSILGGIKSFFGIKSPSKVFRDQIGKNLALGIGVGFENEMQKVERNMIATLGNITPELGLEAQTIGNGNNNLANQIAALINGRNNNVVNNYSFDYKFEKMETSKLALHKAVLATKRDIGG